MADNNNQQKKHCISVPKVYDWVMMEARAEDLFSVGGNGEPGAGVIDPNQPVTLEGCEVVPPGNPPQRRGSGGNSTCTVFDVEDVSLENDQQAQYVRFSKQVTVKFYFAQDTSNGLTARFSHTRTINFPPQHVVLCYPEGTYLECNVAKIRCSLLSQTPSQNGNELRIQVDVFKDVQVFANVKLEVEGTYLQPRNPIELPFSPPQVTFPEPCNFFPNYENKNKN